MLKGLIYTLTAIITLNGSHAMTDKNTAFDILAVHILKHEGGLLVSSLEPGGMANKGITYTTYNSLCLKLLGRQPSETHFKSLSDAEAKVFIKYYWGLSGGDSVASGAIAAWLTEIGWGSGPANGIKHLQTVLNLVFKKGLSVSGTMNTYTATAANSVNASDLFDALTAYRKTFLQAVVNANPAKQKYLAGWYKRVDDFAALKSQLIGSTSISSGSAMKWVLPATVGAVALTAVIVIIKNDKAA